LIDRFTIQWIHSSFEKSLRDIVCEQGVERGTRRETVDERNIASNTNCIIFEAILRWLTLVASSFAGEHHICLSSEWNTNRDVSAATAEWNVTFSS
jgi:hypothetical protein